jgi:hypothetical protein
MSFDGVLRRIDLTRESGRLSPGINSNPSSMFYFDIPSRTVNVYNALSMDCFDDRTCIQLKRIVRQRNGLQNFEDGMADYFVLSKGWVQHAAIDAEAPL